MKNTHSAENCINIAPRSHYYYYLLALVLSSQGVRNYQSVVLCLEWPRQGLRNCQRVGQAHGVKPLNRHWNMLVQERGFPRIGCTQRCPPADLCQENERIISQSIKCLHGHWVEDMAGWQIAVVGCLPLWGGCCCASCLRRTLRHVRCSQCTNNCHVPCGTTAWLPRY